MGRRAPPRQRGPGSGPQKPTSQRRGWTPSEESRLRVHFASLGEDWAAIVAALKKDNFEVRTEQSVLGKLAALGLHEQKSRRQSGGNWDKEKRTQGDKNKKRAAKAAAKSDTSPPAEEPRPKRASTGQPTPTADSGDPPAAAAPVLSDSAQRVAIAHYFINVLDAPPEEEWSERNGTIWTIRVALGIPSGSHNTVLQTLKDVTACAESGQVYTGQRKVGRRRVRALLQVGTPCAKVVANCMERGLGLKRTTVLLNFSRKKRGLLPVGVSAVYGLHLAMKPVVTAIVDNKQGKTDPDTHWSQARHGFSTQMAIRRGFQVELPCLPVIDGRQTQGPVPAAVVAPGRRVLVPRAVSVPVRRDAADPDLRGPVQVPGQAHSGRPERPRHRDPGPRRSQRRPASRGCLRSDGGAARRAAPDSQGAAGEG